MQFQSGSNKVVIELWVLQFWSEIILVVSNRKSWKSCMEIMLKISDQTALHSVQLPLFIKYKINNEYLGLENQEVWIISNQPELIGITRRTNDE